MPITFEEITGEIQRDAGGANTEHAPPAQPGGREDLHQQLEHELRVIAERAARLCAD